MKLILASGSPRRAELLRTLGLVFEASTPGVDESMLPGEPAAAYVERIARDKSLALAEPDAVVIAADTAVAHAGHVLGKPAHPEEARSMLRRLQGGRHDVFTGLAVAVGHYDEPPEVVSAVDVTEVSLLAMTADEIADYVDTGEPMDKAGAYALQGRGGRFVESVRGSPFTVVGLPIHLLARLITSVGSDLSRFSPDRPGGDTGESGRHLFDD